MAPLDARNPALTGSAALADPAVIDGSSTISYMQTLAESQSIYGGLVCNEVMEGDVTALAGYALTTTTTIAA